jgi:hypothetical protein
MFVAKLLGIDERVGPVDWALGAGNSADHESLLSSDY